MRTRLATLFTAIGLLLFFLSGNADACSCVTFTPCQAFGYSSAVFIGQMTDATEKVSEYVANGKKMVVEAGLCTFSVEHAFKGVTGTEVKINVLNMKGTSCEGTGFVRGVKYIVYARYDPSTGLSIGPCSPTTPVEDGKEHLEFLRNLPKEGVGGRLHGRIGREKGSGEPAPMAGITVIVKSDSNQEFKAVTNREGYYELTGLKPGHYTVEPNLPEHYDVYEPKREVEISDRGCVQQSYWVKIKGSLSGRVVDSQGRAASANLRLIAVEDEKERFLGIAYQDGEFVIDDVPPGRYLLYLEVTSAGKEEYSGKEEPYFYPGTFERQYAKIIEVGLGQQLTSYGFTLPSKLKVQLLQGVVKYPDGRPAANASIIVLIKDRTTPGIYRTTDFVGRIQTDEDGRFEVHGLKGNAYELTAAAGIPATAITESKTFYSEPLIIKLDADTKDIKLSLTTTESPLDRVRKPKPTKQ